MTRLIWIFFSIGVFTLAGLFSLAFVSFLMDDFRFMLEAALPMWLLATCCGAMGGFVVD